MSLEEALATLTKAVEKNNELLAVLTSKAKGSAPAPDSKAKSDDSGEADPPARGRGRPPGSANKPKAPSAADMKKAVTEFLEKAGDDDEEYNSRKAVVKKIIAKFEATKFTEFPEEHRVEALKILAKAEETTGGDSGEDDEVI